MKAKLTAPIIPENLKKLVAERIHDPQLRANLKRATDTSLIKRADVVAEYPDWEEMRSKAHEIKKDVIDRLPEYLEEFERNAVANGISVWYAEDAKSACERIGSIIEGRGKAALVKSKSMTTEELHLNPALERMGWTVVETDLGEYIVQLAGEMPSHITAPALHKSRHEIGRLFAEKLGIPYTSEPAELTAVARAVLRERFLAAEVGISGVNFAVANTGSICVVENEGNARLSTTLPRIHVAVMGLEKLVPDTAALLHFLTMLARSATGQRISSYTSIISGPRRNDEIDGPDEVHVIVLDNGRTDLLADEHMREALYCIRCGACLNICPVYQKIGGHAYGAVYPGPIGSVITPVLLGMDRAKAMPYASSLCGACSEICPVRIDLHHLLLRHRQTVVERRLNSAVERWMMKAFLLVMKHPVVYRFAHTVAALLVTLAGDRGVMRVPFWSKTRDFPAPAAVSFAQLWKEREDERS
jgi:L-lactate dehydrogenase complex protein LldF